jgi:hypothetical protein
MAKTVKSKKDIKSLSSYFPKKDPTKEHPNFPKKVSKVIKTEI